MTRRRRFGVVALGIAAVLGFAVWLVPIALRPHHPTPQEITASVIAEAALTDGAQIFATHCAYCHATKIGPPLAGLHLSSQAVGQFVRTGPGVMPAFPPSQISEDDLAKLGGYVSALPAPELRR